MPATKKSKKPNKTKVYECEHYEYEYDDLGKYCWCKNAGMPSNRCEMKNIYCHQFCPGYAKGKLRGEWVVSAEEREEAQKFQKDLAEAARRRTVEELALLKHLKEKYES